jgi:hypothetical protein
VAAKIRPKFGGHSSPYGDFSLRLHRLKACTTNFPMSLFGGSWIW